MKTLLIIFTLISTVFATSLGAAPSPIAAQNFPNINILVNPGFENGSYGWTASGGATKTANSTAKLSGSYGYDWDSNGAAQTLVSNAITIPESLKGQNGYAVCAIKTPSGTATHVLSVDDGTNDLATPVTVMAGSTSSPAPKTTYNFIFPTSGSVRLKLKSVASNEPEIYIDDCYLGSASNLSQISQASIVGTALWTNNTTGKFTTTSATFANLTASSAPTPTVTGNITASSTVAGVTLPTMGPGEYEYDLMGAFYARSTTGGAVRCDIQMHDGTNALDGIEHWGSGSGVSTTVPFFKFHQTVTSAKSNVTVQVQARQYGTNECDILMNTGDNQTANFLIIVKKFPLSSQMAVTSDTSPQSWSGSHGNDCGWTSTSTSFADPASGDASCTFTEISNQNFGTVSSTTIGGNKGPGITFTPKQAGRYRVCTTWGGKNDTGGSASSYSLTDGTTSLASTAINSTSFEPLTLCGDLNATSTSAVTVKLQLGATAASTNSLASAGSLANAINWTINPITVNVPMPVVVGLPTQWQSCNTMAITASGGGSPTKGTVALDQCFYRRVGDSMELRYDYQQTAAGANGSSGAYLFLIPGGFSVDTSKAPLDTTLNVAQSLPGEFWGNTAAATAVRAGYVKAYDSTHIAAVQVSSEVANFVGPSFFALGNAAIGLHIHTLIPISGWSAPSY
jgi:hypothetical protein